VSARVPAPAPTLRFGTPDEVGMSEPRIRHVAELMEEWVKEGVVQTMAVLAARRGVIVLHEAFGKRTPEADAPRTARDSIFELASITKVLTATALMTLVEDGKVGLNRPVAGYIPEFQGAGKDAVLVRHLLTHTSGLRSLEIEKYAKEAQDRLEVPPAPDTLPPLFHEYLFGRYGCPLWKPPGEEMSYANFNLDLAADIVRRVARTPLDRYAHDRLFGPLGMKDTCFGRVGVPRDRRVVEPPSSAEPPPWWREGMDSETAPFYTGSNFAWSTVLDIGIFGQMFLNGGAYGEARVLSPASVAAMTQNQIPGVRSVFFDQVFPEACWGLGWVMHGNKTSWNGALQSPETFGHLGSGGLECWVDPAREMVVVDFSMNRMSQLNTTEWARHWRNDLLSDALTAAIEEP
jgi:serine-type D-Ala-D-Ala carboxypeptidase